MIMKKVLLGVFILMSLLVVTACKEITDDVNKAKQPSIQLKNEGQLIQIYDENIELEDVKFTVIFKNFEENNIQMADVTIEWWIRDVKVDAYSGLTEITQVVNAPGDISVRVVVKFVLEGKDKTLEQDKLISVAKVPTQILITNSIDQSKHQISVKLGTNNDITFNGKITGNLNHPVVRWVIQKQTTGEPEFYDDAIAELTKTGGEANTSFTYVFNETGNYIVTLQTGEGLSQDANRYVSNSIHINVNYGTFELTTLDDLVLNSEAESFERNLLVTELEISDELVEGEYVWFVNNEPIEHSGLTYQHTESQLGGYLYQVKFIEKGTNKVIASTNPVLVVNGLEVSSESELLAALDSEVEGIILTNDIVYSNVSQSLVLDYPVTIYGNGHELSSAEIQVFISVTSDDVKLSNLKIVRAQRYNLMMTRVNNIYLEDLVLAELGGGGDANSFLNGEFGSGVYINKSEVVINNIEFATGGLVGIRIDNDLSTSDKLARLELIGSFKYPDDDALILPIGSGKSSKDGVEVIATGFDYFALPAGNITIRRWDNQGEPITWEIYNPQKTSFEQGEFLDLFGIGINIDIAFLDLEFSGAEGLMFVKMYIKQFKQYGKIEFTTMDNDDEIIKRYYIVGETNTTVYGLDQLVYSLTPELNIENQVEPTLDLEPGQYRMKIYIGEEFYLGHIILTITEPIVPPEA